MHKDAILHIILGNPEAPGVYQARRLSVPCLLLRTLSDLPLCPQFLEKCFPHLVKKDRKNFPCMSCSTVPVCSAPHIVKFGALWIVYMCLRQNKKAAGGGVRPQCFHYLREYTMEAASRKPSEMGIQAHCWSPKNEKAFRA